MPEHAARRGRHEAVVRVVMMAVRTVMMNWMMVFHRLRFLIIMIGLGGTDGRFAQNLSKN